MAERIGVMTNSSCCTPETQQACCQPSEKSACCGTTAADGSCGCAHAGPTTAPEQASKQSILPATPKEPWS